MTAALDLSPVAGEWISATRLAGGILRVKARQHEGALLVEASGHGDYGPGACGQVVADGVFADSASSNTSCAFIATFYGDKLISQMQANQVYGLLTGHTFHRFTDGRRDYFTRECYVPHNKGTSAVGHPASREFPAALRTGRNEPGALVGTWMSLHPAATGRVRALECTATEGGLGVRARGTGRGEPADLGTAAARLYADATRPDDPPAFIATFNHEHLRVYLQARINRGVLVVCEFTEFADESGRSDYFIRECFRLTRRAEA
ncbi:MAG TPA: hypothetical protein VFQ44_03230 [Streptosporangiaceae bacterium]|nr:hypothetical protein [Streptosporangiaceae bacterium]